MIFAARALHKGDFCRDLAGFSQLLKLSIGDYFFAVVAQMCVLGNISRPPAGGQNHCAVNISGSIHSGVFLQTGVGIFLFALVNLLLLVNRHFGRSIPLIFAACCLEGNLERARCAANAGNFGIGLDGDFATAGGCGDELLDVRLLQLRIRISGREHLPPAEGLAAELGGLLNQRHLVARLGGLGGCGQTGDAAAHDQNLFADVLQQIGLGQLAFLRAGDGHADIVLAQLLNEFIAFLGITGNPSHLLAQVAPDGDGVLAEAEHVLHHAGRAGADHEGVDPFLGDVLVDQGQAFRAAKAVMLLHLDAGLGSGVFQALGI